MTIWINDGFFALDMSAIALMSKKSNPFSMSVLKMG